MAHVKAVCGSRAGGRGKEMCLPTWRDTRPSEAAWAASTPSTSVHSREQGSHLQHQVREWVHGKCRRMSWG